MSRFINPYTDFGFKKLFGEEANKDLHQKRGKRIENPQRSNGNYYAVNRIIKRRN